MAQLDTRRCSVISMDRKRLIVEPDEDGHRVSVERPGLGSRSYHVAAGSASEARLDKLLSRNRRDVFTNIEEGKVYVWLSWGMTESVRRNLRTRYPMFGGTP